MRKQKIDKQKGEGRERRTGGKGGREMGGDGIERKAKNKSVFEPLLHRCGDHRWRGRRKTDWQEQIIWSLNEGD